MSTTRLHGHAVQDYTAGHYGNNAGGQASMHSKGVLWRGSNICTYGIPGTPNAHTLGFYYRCKEIDAITVAISAALTPWPDIE